MIESSFGHDFFNGQVSSTRIHILHTGPKFDSFLSVERGEELYYLTENEIETFVPLSTDKKEGSCCPKRIFLKMCNTIWLLKCSVDSDKSLQFCYWQLIIFHDWLIFQLIFFSVLQIFFSLNSLSLVCFNLAIHHFWQFCLLPDHFLEKHPTRGNWPKKRR